ncbi:lactosylceramide 4-alpha-galactosyltransferase-like [Convolutriloba macropyga]|uniref:lactosylceramide 4-alpha-galactosyltransferase-like n=1 Tax=Convolutriloba macropyga TaxID=536237 RepID=UPI003F52779B
MNPITLKLNSKLTFIAFSCLFVSAAIYCFSSFSSPASIQHEKNKDVKSNPKLSTNLFSVFSKSSSSWRITSKYPHCNILVPLPFYNGTSEESDQLFFLETSGKSYLSGRQACSVESAALYSGLPIKVIIRNENLDLSISATTCHLYFNYTNVQFYTVNFTELFLDTPVAGIEERVDRVVAHGITHYSDIGRQAIVYKYGGFYLDLDIVVIKKLTHLKNFYVLQYSNGASPDEFCEIGEGTEIGRSENWLNNAHFQFSKHHQFPWEFLQYVNKTYNPEVSDRRQAGPKVCGIVATRLYNLSRRTNMKIPSDDKSREIQFLPTFKFQPAGFREIGPKLYPKTPQKAEDWEKLFRCSYIVHFYSNKWGRQRVTGDPERDAYSYLGPTYCPLSFKHLDEFNYP